MSCSRNRLIWLFLVVAPLAAAQNSQNSTSTAPPKKDNSATVEEGQLPPDEDKASKVEKQYSFNPLQSKREVSVGEFYFKKGDFNAAAGRFREATKWNEGNADAWLRLGDAEEKMKDSAAAREAWEKYLQLAPQAKNAAEIKKKLEKLKT